MKFRMLSLALVAVLLASFGIAPMAAKATHNPFHEIAVTGTGTLNGVAGTFAGTLNVTRFANDAGDVVALGRLSGTFTDVLGNTRTVSNQLVTAPVTFQQHTCQILELNIGPIHLDLLGLVVDISPIDIEITAERGPGNLLGNLLCAISHLLDNPTGNLDLVVNLLNRILRILG